MQKPYQRDAYFEHAIILDWCKYQNTGLCLQNLISFTNVTNIYFFISACVAKLADVVFVVDSSGSIGMENFAKIKAFVKQTLNFFDIGTDLTRVGLITFNQYGSLQFGLGKYNTSNALVTAVQSIIYSQGGTNTGMTRPEVINRNTLGECLLISSLPGKALRTLVDIARLAERFNMRSQSGTW